MSPATDDDVRAAWKTLAGRGLIAVDWKGLEPTFKADPVLLAIVLGGQEAPFPLEFLPYKEEDGWTDAHRAFQQWLHDELLAAGCTLRTLSPVGMSRVTTDHFVRDGWTVAPPPTPSAEGGEQDDEEVWHEFHDGPWAGRRVQIEPSPDGYEHLIAHRPEPGVGEWVPSDAYPGSARYVRTGSYGETTVMTWRTA